MDIEGFRLRTQLGAGPDGIAYRATAPDGVTTVEVLDLTRAHGAKRIRWDKLVPRLRLAAQLAHPSAIRILDLALDQAAPYAVLEWPGETTLAATISAARSRSERASLELVQDLAAALAAAHRLGLAHGRLGAEHVFHGEDGRVKLDFSGAAVGFPLDALGIGALDATEAGGESGTLAALRSADLYGLGALIARVDWARAEVSGGDSREISAREGSVLGKLARELMAEDPAERPPAREVQARLARLLRPMDATGIWSESASSMEPGTLILATDDQQSLAPRAGAGLLAREDGTSRLGRYQLLEKLGEGGQGVVYRGIDPVDGTVVAIKMLRSEKAENPVVLRRFRKEARLMAEANNPYVVNLLEFNEDDGIPYLVLEFVAGESLGQLLEEKTRLEVPEALGIMAGVARGLVEAHERGIVHRDIKPANILLLSADRIKITDFGLARHVIDSESLAMTDAGALLGTPHYMAPEQWTGRAVDARTDVYAMGATLHHLLAGQPPFTGSTRDELCSQHCNDPPPSLSVLNPGVSEGLARAIARALSKGPEDRFMDAAAMLRDLEALRLGKPTDLAIHPKLPDCDSDRILQFEFRWDLESSPRQLWPLVTNTDRLDRALGFMPVTYHTRYEPGRGVRTFAEGRKAGMPEIGEEYPYEWVEPKRMGILREYSAGPFKWMVSSVELLPRPGGGTTLIHSLRLEPSTWKMRLGSRWGVGVGMRKSLEKVYRRIDATMMSQRGRGISAGVDPFEEPARMPAPRRQRLDRLMDRLVELGIDVAVVDRLAEHLTGGSAQEVARIRPLALAGRFGLDSDQVVAACLHGARLGLLELHWDLLCPVCRISAQVTDTLRAIAEHAHCEACHLDFELDFANSIELIFRVHPEIREADLGTYCVGGPAHSPHVVAQIRVAPHERIELQLELPEGSFRLRGPQLPWSADFVVRKVAGTGRWDIDLVSGPGAEQPPALRAGGQVFALHNTSDQEILIRIERTAPRNDALTAARAASLPLFRELFPGEVLAPGQLATVSTVTLLFTSFDPARADALYHDLGDARAFGMIHEHLQKIGNAIRQGGGAVIKTVGEGVLASFSQVTAAVETALSLPRRLDQSGPSPSAGLRIGIHRGPALAATVNDQLDYFGTTARDAIAILSQARDGELVLTQAVAADPEVAGRYLTSRGIEQPPRSCQLRSPGIGMLSGCGLTGSTTMGRVLSLPGEEAGAAGPLDGSCCNHWLSR